MTFARERLRHPVVLRRARVAAVRRVVPSIARVTLAGPELDGFAAPGPADHVKVFLPDPGTGELVVPSITPDGIRPPAMGEPISRDYTPLAFRPAGTGPAELDVDFVLHGDTGPASAWAERARPGDELAIAGPRGSLLAPDGIDRIVLVVDATALPAASRWLSALAGVRADVVFDGDGETAERYLAATLAGAPAAVFSLAAPGRGGLERALRELGPVGERAFLFLAGEATALVPLRRHLRRELGLPAEQVSVSGYWKEGVVALDHHAPVDPSDPD
jgi:NADPH-dependent ferric siderophore reductase